MACDDRAVPPRPAHVAVGVAVFVFASMLAMLGLPGAASSLGVPDVSGSLAVAVAAAPIPAPVVPEATVPEFAVPEAAVPEAAVSGVTAGSSDIAVLDARDAESPSSADVEAGIVRRLVADAGSGEFVVADGSVPAPGAGTVRTVRVEVERDLPVDRDRFAALVLATLNDPRGWGHGGAMSFARTDGDAPISVMLASPRTSARLCGALDSRGHLSCRNGPQVVLTFARWVLGTEEYADNLTGYRQYVVNHEVGHALGHGHVRCPGPGLPAPVMQQQTLGLKGCTQNPWPNP